MMDGLLLVCLTGICAAPEPFLVYERVAPAVEHAAVAAAETRRIEAPMSSERAAPTIEAPATVEPEASRDSESAGTTSRAVIAAIVKGKSDAVKRCYEIGLADDPAYQGTIEMAWRIDRAGRVSSASVVGRGGGNAAVEGCLRAEIIRWTFPPSAEPVVIGSYPFAFDAALLRHRGARDKSAAATAGR
jgi:hypothetical protein